jgi:hypothetical protein
MYLQSLNGWGGGGGGELSPTHKMIKVLHIKNIKSYYTKFRVYKLPKIYFNDAPLIWTCAP